MNHIDEDTLLRLSLDTVEENEKKLLLDHLDGCSSCSDRFNELRRETEMLGDIDFDLPPPSVPLPPRRTVRWRAHARLAAALIAGFLLGLGFSRISSPSTTTVVASYLAKSAAGQAGGVFVVCESVDLTDR